MQQKRGSLDVGNVASVPLNLYNKGKGLDLWDLKEALGYIIMIFLCNLHTFKFYNNISPLAYYFKVLL